MAHSWGAGMDLAEVNTLSQAVAFFNAKKLALDRSGRLYIVIFGIGTVIRVLLLLIARGHPSASDAQDYVEAARKLVSGEHFVPYWPPGLPLYLAGLLRLGAGVLTLRACMLFFWVILAGAIWKGAGELGLKQWASSVLLFVALMPTSIQLSVDTLTQQPVASLLLLALASGIAWGRNGRWRDAILLGFSLGWMALIRPSSLLLVVAIPVICAVGAMRLRRVNWFAVAVPIMLGGVMIAGWMVHAHKLCGAWIINSSNGVNLYDGNNPWTPLYKTWYFGSHAKPGSAEIGQFPEFATVVNRVWTLPPLQASAEFQRLAVEDIRQHPMVFLVRTANRVRCFFGFPTFAALNLRSSGVSARLFPVVLAADALIYFGLLGASLFWLSSASSKLWRRWEVGLILATVVIYAAPYWLSMSHPTYNFPTVLPIVLLGVLAWRSGFAEPRAIWRGWLVLFLFSLIQVEWVYQSLRG